VFIAYFATYIEALKFKTHIHEDEQTDAVRGLELLPKPRLKLDQTDGALGVAA
jgi:hypothetical protein